MKRIFAAVLAVLMLCPMLLSAMPVSAAEEVNVGYSSPAICTDAGKAVDLTKVAVQFESGTDCVPAAQLTWKDGDKAIASFTPTEKGVYPLTVTANGKTKTVYVVAKNANESEYVLYENDYSVSPDLSQFRVIQQPSGTTFGYDEAEGALYLDTSNDGSNHMRVLLPSYLDAFGDAIYSARVKITKQTANSRFGALIFRLQDPTGKKIPYMQTAFRYDISASNGLEIAERTASDAWSVTQKTSVSGIKGGDYFEVTANFCGSKSTSTVNGKTYLTENNTPYNAGSMGLQVRGARMTVDWIKITVNPGTQIFEKPITLRDTRDPESNIALEPALITEVGTEAQLKALETTLPAIAIFDCVMNVSDIGVKLDGKFTKLEELGVCERVIPAYRVDSQEEAMALGKYASSLAIADLYVISANPALINAARVKCDMIYGMLDATGKTYADEELRGICIECGARGAILDAAVATRNYVSYLQDRYLVVWQAVTERDISAVSAINNGVLGLITPDVKATEACFTKYYDKNTLVRTPEIIGHRGNPSTQQENTVAGSVEAFKLGATMVENDIYLMRDGNIVVMHDGTLDRTTNGSGNIVEQTAETIKKFKVDSNAKVPAEPIPLLKDYFEEFKGTGEVLVVELKSSDTKMGAPLAKLIKEYGMERQVVIIAFNKGMINSIRAAAPDISVNFLTSDITADENRSLDVAKQVVENVIPINTAYSPSQAAGTLGINLYSDLAVRGITLWNWTVNDQDKFNSYFVSGIRGITTNYTQWAGTLVEDFNAYYGEDGKIVLEATAYNGSKSGTSAAELVVIGGTGTYEDGVVTLSEGAEGFFFRIKKTITSRVTYSVVTPVILASEIVNEETTSAPETTLAPETEPVTDPITEPTAEGGCGGMISLSLLALIPVAELIIKKKEDQ